MLERARTTAKTLPPFAAAQGPLDFKRLGGLTNLVFRVTGGDLPAPLLLRLPGQGTEEFINRRVEKTAAEETGRVGVPGTAWAYFKTLCLGPPSENENSVRPEPTLRQGLGPRK